MRLISSAFADGAKMPARFTCDSGDVSPPLAWSGARQRTQSFAIVCSDPDAPGGVWFHRAIFDVPAGTTRLDDHYPSEDGMARPALNDFHHRFYRGPCPPRGHARHRYHFKLYALDTEHLDLPADAGCRDVEAEAEMHALATAELITVYSR